MVLLLTRLAASVTTPSSGLEDHTARSRRTALQVAANGAIGSARKPDTAAAGPRQSSQFIRREQSKSSPFDAAEAFPTPFLKFASFLETEGLSTLSESSSPSESPAPASAAEKHVALTATVAPTQKAEAPVARTQTQNSQQPAPVPEQLEARPTAADAAAAGVRSNKSSSTGSSRDAAIATTPAANLTKAVQQLAIGAAESPSIGGEAAAAKPSPAPAFEAYIYRAAAPWPKLPNRTEDKIGRSAPSQESKPLAVSAPVSQAMNKTVHVGQKLDASPQKRRSSAVRVLLFGLGLMSVLAVLAMCAFMLAQPNHVLSKQQLQKSAQTRYEGSRRLASGGATPPAQHHPQAANSTPMVPPALAVAVSAAAAAARPATPTHRGFTSGSETCL